MKKQLTITFIISTLILSSCASSTLIESQPTKANVFINEEFAGKTPLTMTDTKLSMTTTYLRIEKDGYIPLRTVIIKDEEVNVGAAVAGIFLYFPWLWVFDYKPSHTYLLEPATNNPNNDNIISGADNPPPPPTNSNNKTTTNSKSKAQKLKDIKELYNDGILSQKEYENEKQKILDEENW